MPYKVHVLSPEEELNKITLPEGYKLELVLSDPDMKEPGGVSFDGIGRMYVVEMRTCIQDVGGNAGACADRVGFITSTDPNFRVVNMTTGPDGCLYLVDMYRGIIRESHWTKDGSCLREQVLNYGLNKNLGHTRVWRLVHMDFNPGPQPNI